MPNYADNLSQRTPCMLLLDASASMTAVEHNGRTRIDLLNEGLATFHADLMSDHLALSRVQVAAVNVGGFSGTPQLFLDWTDAADFRPFPMSPGYDTPLGAGMLLALEAIEQQKATLRGMGIPYTRPWLMVLTDGAPTDPDPVWLEACRRAREHEAASKVQIFPIGIGTADYGKLSQLSVVAPKRLEASRFRELFSWLSASLGAVSRSVPGAHVDLPSTDPWAAVRL